MTLFRQRCLAKESLVGTFIAIPHPVAIEVVAQSGPAFLCIDWEHAQITRAEIENLIRTADANRLPAMVRVPGHSSEAIAAALDSGARGVLVPRVSTAEQAAAAVKAARYPPLGERGVGPGRASGYGYGLAGYLARANDEILVAVQVETAEGLANAQAIAATPGVDMVFVGPGDLSVSIGAMGPENAPRLERTIAAILEAALAGGKAAGIFCFRPEDAGRWAKSGATFFIVASDTMFLGAAASATLSAVDQSLEASSGSAGEAKI